MANGFPLQAHTEALFKAENDPLTNRPGWVFDARCHTRVTRFTLDVYAPLDALQQPNIGSIGISVGGVQAMNPNE